MPVPSLSFLPYRALSIATLHWQLRLPAPMRFHHLTRNYELQRWIGNHAFPCPSFHFPFYPTGNLRLQRWIGNYASLHPCASISHFTLRGITICSTGLATTPLHARPFTFPALGTAALTGPPALAPLCIFCLEPATFYPTCCCI
jgi:hypothetical protein